MKHPQELDLHDLDKLEIERLERENARLLTVAEDYVTLEQENIQLSVDLENALDKLAECEGELND